jgi:hypothetical protein
MKLKEHFADQIHTQAQLMGLTYNPQFHGELVTGDWFMFMEEDAGQTFAAAAKAGV